MWLQWTAPCQPFHPLLVYPDYIKYIAYSTLLQMTDVMFSLKHVFFGKVKTLPVIHMFLYLGHPKTIKLRERELKASDK